MDTPATTRPFFKDGETLTERKSSLFSSAYSTSALREPLSCSIAVLCLFFFFSSRRRHTRFQGDWSSDVCSSDLPYLNPLRTSPPLRPEKPVHAHPASGRADPRPAERAPRFPCLRSGRVHGDRKSVV